MPSETILTGVTGIVLAGGLSSRLGHDKTQLRLGGGGIELLAQSVALLRGVCGRALVVGRQHPEYECVADAFPRQGPVGGIATALMAATMPCLVLSCDLPFMNGDVLRKLVAAHAARPPGVLCTSYMQAETGHKEALVAIYEPECLPYFCACLAKGHLKVSRVVPEELQHFLVYHAHESLPFFNINYPADLEVALRIFSLTGSSGGTEE